MGNAREGLRVFETRKTEEELKKAEIVAAAKELNRTLQLEPQINILSAQR